jgi:catechol 2,3-dioxygenase-like lactoylglutathione lyase family enzyme
MDPIPLASARGVTLDNSGNIYVAGYAKGNLNGETNSGGEDPFLMKFDSSGNPIWTRLWGNVTHNYGYGVTVYGSDNIYVVGKAFGDWDGQTNSGEIDAFITKFNGSGARQWTRFVGDAGFDAAYAATVDGSGNIYVAGDIDNALNLPDAFLAKFDALGNRLWQTPILLSTPGCDHARGVAVDNLGNIYVSGMAEGDLADMDGLPHLGDFDAFLAKFYPSGGDPQWIKVWGTSSADHAVSVVIAGDDIYVGGDSSGSLDGNPNAGGHDLYLIKLNSNGQRQ